MRRFPGSLVDIEYCLPNKVVTNEEFQLTHPEWRIGEVAKRTGVMQRHIARVDETAYDLALVAAKKLLDKHRSLSSKIGAIIFCTQSPDYLMPSNAFLLQRDLDLPGSILAFDYNLACSGYVYGLLIASSLIKTGIVSDVLLVTADTYSKYIRDDDRSTRMLFGDGAAASWISNDNFPGIDPLIGLFNDFQCDSDGHGWDKFIIRSGGSREPGPSCDSAESVRDKIFMDGLQVLNLVNDRVIRQILDLLDKNDLKPHEIHQFFLHQASELALNSLRKKLKIDKSFAYSNIEKIGNTVSSSIPILIKDYFSLTSSPAGSRFLISGFGVGYSFGSVLVTK